MTKFWTNFKLQLAILILVGLITWFSSLHSEFVGYDDLDLVLKNQDFASDIFTIIDYNWATASASYNIAWTNIPTTIYRPLQWWVSAIAFKIFSSEPFYYHLFFNYLIHITNTVLVFFILRKLSDSKHLPFLVSLIWTVHPLHHEAMNMLTSGPGFLLAHLLMFLAIYTLLSINHCRELHDRCFALGAGMLMFIAFLGSEMCLILALSLIIYLLINPDIRSPISKIFITIVSILFYVLHRKSIVTEHNEWLSSGFTELYERAFIVAPQILLHYFKQVFYPVKLGIDQHHNVILENLFKPNHILALILVLLICLTIVCGFLWKKEYKSLSLILGFALINIAMVLNIVPCYVLARDRYTYIFSLAIIAFVLVFFDKLIKLERPRVVVLSSLSAIAVILFSYTAYIKNQDWSNGEKLWTSTINSVEDIGTKQNWRYRLLQYYRNPGTSTFVMDRSIYDKIKNDFEQFPLENNLLDQSVIERYKQASQDPSRYILYKYGFTAHKSIASGLYYNAIAKLETRDLMGSARLLKVAHQYYPEHFQVNLRLLVHSWVYEPQNADHYLGYLIEPAERSSVLARWLVQTLVYLKHPLADYYKDYFTKRFKMSL